MATKDKEVFGIVAPGVFGPRSLCGTPYAADYAKLVGKTVKRIQLQDSEGSPHLKPVIVFTDGTTAFVMCDDEGNGPGALAIESPKPASRVEMAVGA